MKIYSINLFTQNFTGKRQDRKNVEQLKKNNPYDLNIINQRNINNSIDNLSNVPGQKNVNFLLDVSEKLKYGTNIDLGKTPYNDWRVKLNNAARKAIESSPKKDQQKLYARLDRIENTKKPLTPQERKILELRQSILDKVDRKELANIKNENIKNFDNNFDYLISSSEIPTNQKVYILEKLDYLMSPEYRVNILLMDKKTQILAEVVNDLVINTPESKIPNIKAVNQNQHGMCAAISLCRKALAYEDKKNYIDMILTELDNNPYMMVYDIAKLGSNRKIPIDKPYIDYQYAMQKGYRIIDTSVLNWMSIANTVGSSCEENENYVTFDKKYFDTFAGLNIFKDINDELAPEQDYHRALLRSKETLAKCKENAIRQDYKQLNRKTKQAEDIKLIQKYTPVLRKTLNQIYPTISDAENQKIVTELLTLEQQDSKTLNKSNSQLKEFMYIENEPETMKTNKIHNYILKKLPEADTNKLNELTPEILNLITTINSLKNKKTSSHAGLTINRAKDLYAAAAAYRIQYDFGLENKDRIREMSKVLNIPDSETLIIQNMETLIDKLKKGKLQPEIKEALAYRFELYGDGSLDEMLIAALEENKEGYKEALTGILDDLHKVSLQENRKFVLINNLLTAKAGIEEDNDKELLEGMAQELNMPADKKKIIKKIDEYIATLNDENCTQEQYLKIYNQLGGKNQLSDFKGTLQNLGKALFDDNESKPEIIKGFNLLNGLPINAPKEQTLGIYMSIVNHYNTLANLTATLQNVLEIKNADNEVINTVKPKEVIMKKLENVNEIISEKDLRMLQERFAKIDQARINPDGTTKYYKDLPKELTTLTPREKEVLKTIEKHINKWYSATTRNLYIQHKDYQKEFDELSRQIGLNEGFTWIKEGRQGLDDRAQIKIFEHMTDRPYYSERDTKKAIETIKKSPYSGNSSMSMLSDERALHAQYIADIKPIEIKTPNGTVQKEALFHDNTWGSSEHENVWTDDQGLLRTDYSMESGGELGFITDNNYLSGKLLENLLDDIGEYKPDNIDSKKYKILNKGDDSNYKFKMFNSIITPGEDPRTNSTVSAIKDLTMIKPDEHLDDLIEAAEKMTRDEVEQRIKNIELCGSNIQEEYENIDKRIWGKKPFIKGIETKEDYDKLPNNDKLKLLLEKTAILLSYYSIPELIETYTENLNETSIKNLKNRVHQEARKNFDYAFGKDPNIAISGAIDSANEIYNLLVAYQMETRVRIPNKDIKYILKSMRNIDKTRFDGSLNTTINLMLEKFKQAMEEKTLNCENKEAKINELLQGVQAILTKNMYFNKKDLTSNNLKKYNMPAIEKWIDDNFDPTDDKEFVKIYNKMQDMTTEEFNKKYNSKIDDKALGIKPLTGYDMLKQYRALNESVDNVIFNNIYYKEFYKNTQKSTTIPRYEYTKLTRKPKGATYKGKRTFDDIYTDYYYSLKGLTLDKIYGRYKDFAFKNYGTYPAYAKVETQDEKLFETGIIDLFTDMSEIIETISDIKKMQVYIKQMKKLKNYIARIDDNATLTETQKEHILKVITQFHNEYMLDETLDPEIKMINEIIIKITQNEPFSEIKPLANKLVNGIIECETNSEGKTLSQLQDENLKDLKQLQFSYIMQVVDPKYHKNAFELSNKWIKAKAKGVPEADMYYADFKFFLDKHNIINTPDKLLKDYLLLLAKPTETNNPYKEMTEEQKKEIENLKNIYDKNISSLLYSANLVEIQQLLMRSTKKGSLNLIKNELKNTRLPLRNGLVTDLYSDAGLSLILNNMYDEGELETALMFIDQLGLEDRVVEMYSRITDFDKAKAAVKRIHSVLNSVDKQVAYINKEIEKLSDIDTDPNYKQRMLETKERIDKFCKRTSFRKSIKNIDKVMNGLIDEFEKNPNLPKYKNIRNNINYLNLKNIEQAQNYVKRPNAILKQVQDIQALLMKIKLRNNSPALEQREEFFKKITDLETFTEKYYTKYPNLSLSTGNKK